MEISINDSISEATGLTFDSRRVKPGDIFFCKGAHFDPAYLADAESKGAIAYVSERLYPGPSIPAIIVPDVRKAMANAAAQFYEGLRERLTLIGITGTKGKSTVTHYVRSILDDWLTSKDLPRAAVLSGIENYDGVSSEEARLTTDEIFETYRHMQNAVDSGIEYMVIEVSSQALKYDRLTGISFDVACFLNIGDDHISDVEHADFEDYFSSKLKIFAGSKYACVNKDTDYSERVLATAAQSGAHIVTFGIAKRADFYGYDVKSQAGGTCVNVRTQHGAGELFVPAIGHFSAQNAVAAACVADTLNIPFENIRDGLKSAHTPGRMELFDGSDDKVIIVDYAHNGMSFDAVFDAAHEAYPDRYISAVFGSVGGKAYTRRKGMAEAAAQYTDKIYLTEDDPGSESVIEICEEMAGYYTAVGGAAYDIICDRRIAIQAAIKEAPSHSVILVLGKGYETTQKRAEGPEPVPSDIEVVKSISRGADKW